MPRNMPPLATRFGSAADKAIDLPSVVESLRLRAAFQNIKRDLTIGRMELLYEVAFLRLFAAWEAFIEDSLIHMLCGFTSPLYTPIFQPGVLREQTFTAAQSKLFNGRQYALWYDPAAIQRRASAHFIGSPQEAVANSNSARLTWFAAIRNRIAHDSADAQTKFDQASMNLAGRRYAGSRPGKMLRSLDRSSNKLYLISTATEFKALALQIAP